MNEKNNLMENGSLWFPEAASQYADSFDLFYNAIYYFSIFLLVVVFGAAMYFAIRYRRTSDNQVAEVQIKHNTKLEVVWIIVPTILVMIVFAWGFRDYMVSSVPPDNVIEYKVIGQKWNWIFFDPVTGQQSSELVVPVGRNIKLLMNSVDVLHSFFIPNYRIKRDVIPGRYTVLWFSAEKVGNYHVLCAEYCGDSHSTMLANIKVVDKAEYDAYVAAAKASLNIPPIELGEKLYTQYGCSACHSLDGRPMVGPSWKGLYGSQRQFTDGTTASADENYLRTSITMPANDIVQGYNNVMPSFAYLSEKELDGLIEYIKTIK